MVKGSGVEESAVEESGNTGSGFPVRVLRRVSRAVFRPELILAAVWWIPAIVGGALGTVVWLVTGWPWWPLVGAAALWTTAVLLPVYWPGFRATRWSLLTELLTVLWPRRGMSRLHAEEERRFRRPALPLYGLPAGFPGGRQLGATGTGGTWWGGYVVRRLSLGHGDTHRRPGETWLIVETVSAQAVPTDAARRKNLAERLWNRRLLACGDMDELRRVRAEIAGQPDPIWSKTTVEVDGAPVEFEFLAEGECWVAWAVHDGVVLNLLASLMPIETVTLVPITDVEPYIDGSRTARATPFCPVPPVRPA